MAKRKVKKSLKSQKKYWFSAKLYGWGWTPSSWQGWVAILAYMLFAIWDFRRIDSVSHSVSDTLIGFTPEFALATIALLALCYFTAEKPRWRWGK